MEKKDLTIILVHGAWGDGSHWQHVIPRLVKAGYQVRSAQNPLTSLTHDIERTTDLINAQEGKVLLVGYSYGGSVISGAGNNQKVIGLVYIAAFAPDAGESLSRIFQDMKHLQVRQVSIRTAKVSYGSNMMNIGLTSVPIWTKIRLWCYLSPSDLFMRPVLKSLQLNPHGAQSRAGIRCQMQII